MLLAIIETYICNNDIIVYGAKAPRPEGQHGSEKNMTLYETNGREHHDRVWRTLTQRDIDQIEKHSHRGSLDFDGVLSGRMMEIIPDLNLFHFNGMKCDVMEYMTNYRNDDAMVGRKVTDHIKMNERREKNGYPKLPFYEGQVEIHKLGCCNWVV